MRWLLAAALSPEGGRFVFQAVRWRLPYGQRLQRLDIVTSKTTLTRNIIIRERGYAQHFRSSFGSGARRGLWSDRAGQASGARAQRDQIARRRPLPGHSSHDARHILHAAHRFDELREEHRAACGQGRMSGLN